MSAKKSLTRPRGKRLLYCLTFLHDHDPAGALLRAGYARVSEQSILAIEQDPLVQQEILNIKRFAAHFYEHLDMDGAFCSAYDVHVADAQLYENEIRDLACSDSVKAELKTIRSGQVELPAEYIEFANEWLATNSIVRSAMKVWPDISYNAAAAKGSVLLKKPKIREYLLRKRKELEARLDINPEWVLRRLADRADAKITDFVDIKENGRVRVKAIEDLPESKQRLLRGFSNGQGGVSVKIPDGGQELVAIARILGMFNTDFNTLLAAIRRFGFVVKRLAHGGYELIPEDQVVSEGLDSLDDFDEPTDLPWDAAEA